MAVSSNTNCSAVNLLRLKRGTVCKTTEMRGRGQENNDYSKLLKMTSTSNVNDQVNETESTLNRVLVQNTIQIKTFI